MPRVSWSVLPSFVAFCFTWCGCCGRFDSTTTKSDEAALAWLTQSWSGRYDWEQSVAWRNIADSKLPQPEFFLQEASPVQVSWAQAQELIGGASFPVFKGTPYLLRAVGDSHNRLPLALSVRPNGEVWVGGGANSKCPVAKRRKAVVAWLDKEPRKVFVTFEANRD